MNILQLSWKNLTYKPLNMALSLLLFALGIGLISLLLLVNTQLQKQFEKNLAGIDLVIGAKGSPLQLILSSMYHIDSPTGNISIAEARPFLNPNHPLIALAVPLSLGDSHHGYRIVGTTIDFVQLYDAKIAEGRLWEKSFEVSIGSGVAQKMGLKIGDIFQSSHGFVLDDNLVHGDANPFVVVGIFQPSGSVIDQLILTDTRSVWAVHDHAAEGAEEHDHEGHDHIEETTVKPLIEETDKEITSLLLRFRNHGYQSLNMQRNINENTDLQAATPAIEINRLYSMMGVGADTLKVLAIIIIIVSGLSIFVSLYSSLKERRYELALMRVMGASRERLFMLLILEGLLLAVLGCMLGLLLSHGGMEILSDYLQKAYRYPFTGRLFLREEAWLVLGALIIGFVAAVLPAVQASQTDISDTLTAS